MEKMKYVNTKFTLIDYLYDDLWKVMACNNTSTHTIGMTEFETVLDGGDQCGEELDDCLDFALNLVFLSLNVFELY